MFSFLLSAAAMWCMIWDFHLALWFTNREFVLWKLVADADWDLRMHCSGVVLSIAQVSILLIMS